MSGLVVACGVGPSVAAELTSGTPRCRGKSDALCAVRDARAPSGGPVLWMDYGFTRLSVRKRRFP